MSWLLLRPTYAKAFNEEWSILLTVGYVSFKLGHYPKIEPVKKAAVTKKAPVKKIPVVKAKMAAAPENAAVASTETAAS